MNMAIAISAAPSASALMTARNGQSVDEGAPGGTPSVAEQDRSVFQRFPVIAFSYEADASRLVMLYRDPDTGTTIEQIPSEAALKQYKEQQAKERRKEIAEMRLLVGGSDPAVPGNSGAMSRGTPSAAGTSGADAVAVSPAVAAGTARTGGGGAPQSGVNLLV